MLSIEDNTDVRREINLIVAIYWKQHLCDNTDDMREVKSIYCYLLKIALILWDKLM